MVLMGVGEVKQVTDTLRSLRRNPPTTAGESEGVEAPAVPTADPVWPARAAFELIGSSLEAEGAALERGAAEAGWEGIPEEAGGWPAGVEAGGGQTNLPARPWSFPLKGALVMEARILGGAATAAGFAAVGAAGGKGVGSGAFQ